MKRTLFGSWLLAALTVANGISLDGQGPITGTWTTTAFGGPNLIDLQVDGTAVTGTISRNQQVVDIYDGRVDGNTVSFKVAFAAGGRVNRYTGTVKGDEMAVKRSVQVRPNGQEAGEGIFGAGGPMEFVAKREATSSAVPSSLLGNWKLNVLRSTFEPGPAPRPTVPDTRNYVLRPGGSIGLLVVNVGTDGGPNFNLAVLRADGKDYPVHSAATLAGLLDASTATTLTTSMRMAAPRSFDVTNKTNEVTTSTRQVTVSRDGNTLIERIRTVDAKGQTTATNTLVFDRIGPAIPVPVENE